MKIQSTSVFILPVIIIVVLLLYTQPHGDTIINISKSVFNHHKDLMNSEIHRIQPKGDSRNVTMERMKSERLEVDLNKTDKCQSMDSNDTCQPLNYSQRLMPLTALYSFPGSGNTWLRHLIQQMTGIYTGSVYNDTDLKENGFPGESREDRHVVVIKTHRPDTVESYERAIILIRNPFDALFAEFQRHKEGHVSGITKEDFIEEKMGIKFDQFLMKQFKEGKLRKVDAWLNTTLNVLNAVASNMPTLVVHYENLRNNLKHELIRICSFLGLTIWADVLECTICNAEGSNHRKTEKFFPYTKTHVSIISSNIKTANETLKATCGESCAMPHYVIPNVIY